MVTVPNCDASPSIRKTKRMAWLLKQTNMDQNIHILTNINGLVCWKNTETAFFASYYMFCHKIFPSSNSRTISTQQLYIRIDISALLQAANTIFKYTLLFISSLRIFTAVRKHYNSRASTLWTLNLCTGPRFTIYQYTSI